MKEFIAVINAKINFAKESQELVKNHPTMSEELKQWNLDRLEKCIQDNQSLLDQYTK